MRFVRAITLLSMAVGLFAFIPAGLSPAQASTTASCTASCTTEVSGLVTAFVKATASVNGSITIDGKTFVIKAGTSVSSLIKVGVKAKLQITLNAKGQITTCTVINVTLKVSGTVTAFVKATATANGSITIDGKTFVIKAGTSLSSVIKVGLNVNLQVTLNAKGEIIACVVINVTVSGKVTLLVNATLLTTGTLVIDGHTFVIAKGVLFLDICVALNVDVTLTLKLNSQGQIIQCECK